MTAKNIAIAGGVVLALVVGIYLLDGHYSKKVLDQQAIAQEAVGRAAQLETEAKNAKKDAQIAEDTAEVISRKLVKAEADVKRLKQRVSELASVPQSVVTVGGEVTPEHVALDQAKDEYIGSIENEIIESIGDTSYKGTLFSKLIRKLSLPGGEASDWGI